MRPGPRHRISREARRVEPRMLADDEDLVINLKTGARVGL